MPHINPRQHQLSTHERAVQNAGYPWVSITTLNPTGTGNTITGGGRPVIPDRLGRHSHHSRNTHLIISGRLTLHLPGGRVRILDADSRNPSQREAAIPAGMSYSGVSGPNGAVFVEGHELLSPATIGRFQARGDLVWYHDGPTERQWLAQQQQHHRQDIRPINQTGLLFNKGY